MTLIKIGRSFYDDCVCCDCDVPVAVSETKVTVTIDTDDSRIQELISRAWLYVHPHGPGNDEPSLKASAKRTLQKLGEI